LIETRGPVEKAISNTMRNVFGMAGIFIWAFAGTCNNMVANLIGQGKQEWVIPTVKRISLWSLGFCVIIVLLLNIQPLFFFSLFGQDQSFMDVGTPVIRVVSLGMVFMSVSNVWLNAVTGTGKTKVSLVIEIITITLYLIYTLYFMKYNYISLAMAWSNEFVYWTSILLLTSGYMFSKRWQKVTNNS
jgi:Na+-driven multidrug efflux pump